MRHPWWSLHSHSRYSVDDALPAVEAMVDRAVELGYPALGLTDHGTMAGAVALYNACRKAGIEPLPGIELYLTPDSSAREQRSMHLTVASYTETGFRNLVRLATLAHQKYYFRPRVDFADLAQLAEDGYTAGLAIGTGCRSGAVVRTLQARGAPAAARIASALAGWFPRVYVELMHHDFTADGWSESDLVDGLLEVADIAGLPYIITSDSHYTVPEDQADHDALKELVSWSEDPADGRFSGSGYFLPTVGDLKGFSPAVIERACANLTDLAEHAAVRLPELETFSLRVPDVTVRGEPQAELEERVAKALEAYVADMPRARQKRYRERLNDECGVIERSGMAGYLLLVAHVTDFCAEREIWFHTRGSATGSLVCRLLGITQEDPVFWGIRMDRFLSGDRTSPPDIDVDIEDGRREEVFAMLDKRWYTRKVGTVMKLGLEDEGEDQKGSLRVRYYSTLRKRGVEAMPAWKDVPAADKATLNRLAARKLVAGYGAHPAGVVVSESEKALEILPLVRIGSSGQLVTAYDKDDVEQLGFPKIDLLGSRVLTAIRICCELLASTDPKERTAQQIYEAIPLDDRETYKRISAGKTAGMFQLEGWTQQKAMLAVKPKRIQDIIACQALYRTGVSKEFQAGFLARRRGDVPVPQHCDDIAAETKDTYGIAIYQEQLVGVLRRIGMEPVALTRMLKAIKSSGKAGIVKAKKAADEALPGILALTEGRGWSDADVEWLRRSLLDHAAGYSFNLAHSVQYGLVAYRTGWLAQNEPLAFWTGMLIAYTGAKKGGRDAEKVYQVAARDDDVGFVKAHVNHSGVHYVAEPDSFRIRRGLLSIKGVGQGAAEELCAHAPYESLKDLGQKVLPKKVTGARKLLAGTPPQDCGGVITALATAGALGGLQ